MHSLYAFCNKMCFFLFQSEAVEAMPTASTASASASVSGGDPPLPYLPEGSVPTESSESNLNLPSVPLPGILGAQQLVKKQPKIMEFIADKKPYHIHSQKAVEITKAIAEFVALDMRPISVVDGSGFRNLLHTLDSRYKMVSRNHLLERYLVPMHNLCKEAVKLDIAQSPSHSFTTDAWSSKSMESYITTTAHYIDSAFELKSNVLDTHRVSGSHTADMLGKEMLETQIKWGLKEITGVSDNASNVQAAFDVTKIPRVRCFPHTINLAVGKGLEESNVKRILWKVRSIVTTFKTSHLKTEALKDNEKLQGLKVIILISYDFTTIIKESMI